MRIRAIPRRRIDHSSPIGLTGEKGEAEVGILYHHIPHSLLHAYPCVQLAGHWAYALSLKPECPGTIQVKHKAVDSALNDLLERGLINTDQLAELLRNPETRAHEARLNQAMQSDI